MLGIGGAKLCQRVLYNICRGAFYGLPPMYHGLALYGLAFGCFALLWSKNEVIPHIIDIQDYLFRFAAVCPTKKPPLSRWLEPKPGLEPGTSSLRVKRSTN